MQVYIRMKAAGKRRDILQPTAYPIPDTVASLRQLLTAVVEREVDRYNSKDPDTRMIPFLTQRQIDDQAEAGKVSFGTVFSDQKAHKGKAVDNAIQCWRDGLVRVFLNETELTQLDTPLSIPENAELTFIRLTFLAGRMW